MEKIKRDPNRVAITGSCPPTNRAGGDRRLHHQKGPARPRRLRVPHQRGQRLAYVEPKENQITAAQADYLRGYLDDFEAALYGPDFTDPVIGYAAYIDVDTFIDHHILVELTKNIDGYRLSTFFFKDREDKLQAGPDLGLQPLVWATPTTSQGWLPEGWYYELLSSSNYPWWPRMFEDDEFQLRYADRWHELRRDQFRTENLLGDIDAYAALIDEAQQRNFVRWPVLGQYVWPNWFIADTYREEIDWMKQWLADRLEWMDGQFSPPPVFNHPGGLIPTGSASRSAPPTGMIYYTLDGSGPRLPGGAISPERDALLVTAGADRRPITGHRPHTGRSDLERLQRGRLRADTARLPQRGPPVNVSVLSDEQGEFDPWIELYNAFPDSIDLGGLYLTDVQGDPFKWPLPSGTTALRGTGG